MMNRAYLSGPMTGIVDWNFPLFNAEAKRLRALGWDIANPAENGNEGKPWHMCLRKDIAQLVTCDFLFLLPNWMNSEGAHLEMLVAKRVQIEIQMATDITFGPSLVTLGPSLDQKSVLPAHHVV